MNEKIYYSAADIAAMLGVSTGKAYKILREMNKDLADKGFLTIAGKIPVEYFKERWYGGKKEVSAWVVVRKEIQMVHGEYSTAGLTGREQKESRRKEDLRPRKKRRIGIHIFCCSSLLIRQYRWRIFGKYTRLIWKSGCAKLPCSRKCM